MVSEPLRQVMLAAEGCGELDGADARTGRAEHPVCGDEVALHLRLRDGLITELAWQARGCVACMAVTAAAWQAVPGSTVAEAPERLRVRLEELGGLQPFERHAEKLVVRALQRAVGEA